MSERERRWAAAMRAERKGDVTTYEQLLGEIARSARPIVRSRLRPTDDGAEDIVQEILIGIHNMRSRWDESRPILPWIHAIIRYKVNDALRKHSRDARRRSDLSFEEWEAIADQSLTEPMQAPVDVERHLQTLSPDQQDIVRSLAIDEASVRQVATRLQKSEGAVRVTLHRALQRLRAISGHVAPRVAATGSSRKR